MLYKFIVSDKTFEITDENSFEILIKIFSNSKLSNIIHWNIIMEVDKDLLDIIKTYNWLLKCLKFLNEKNTFLFLVKISDILPNIINSSFQIWELLSKLPDDSNKIKFLKRLRLQNLKKVIKDASDLWNIFEWLYWESQDEFIDYLWDDFIRYVFLWTNEIIMILNFLNDKNKDRIIDIIWFWNLKNKVKTSKNFLTMFSWLSDKKAKLFLIKFTKQEIKDLFKNDEDFYQFMLRLSCVKEKIFLKYLWF